MFTVKQMREAIADRPDDAPILIRPTEQAEFASEAWRYNTREIHNAYGANDDRYDQNQIVLIEMGETSP